MHFDSNITDNINLQLKPNCLETNNSGCDIKYKEIKNITLAIKVKSCLSKNEIIALSTMTNDKILIEVETICKCPCENSKENQEKCSHNGKFECGVCRCNENR